MVSPETSVPTVLEDAINRTHDAQDTYRAARIDQMNGVADTLVARGPLPNSVGRQAFLFAMYGVEEHWRDEDKSPEQIQYEKLERKFGHHHINQAFSLSTDTHHDGEPYRLFAYHDSQYNAWLSHERPSGEEFSAVEYEVTRGRDAYIGSIAIPASSIRMDEFNTLRPDASLADASTIRQMRAMVLKVERNSDSDQAQVRSPFDGNLPEARFGRHIAHWAENYYGLGYYKKIIDSIIQAEEALKASAKA